MNLPPQPSTQPAPPAAEFHCGAGPTAGRAKIRQGLALGLALAFWIPGSWQTVHAADATKAAPARALRAPDARRPLHHGNGGAQASRDSDTTRRLTGQLAASIDAGDSFATPGGRSYLRRLPGAVAVETTESQTRAGTVASVSPIPELTRAGGPLTGFREQHRLRQGISILAATNPAPRTRISPPRTTSPTEVDAHRSLLQRARQSRGGTAVNPVFVDPKTGLRLVATKRLIIRLEPGTDARQHFGPDWRRVEPLWGTTDQFVLTLPAGSDSAEAVLAEADRQSSRPGVAWAEPDFIREMVRSGTPNDPYFSRQWHLENSGQDGATPGADARLTSAWDLTTGRSNIVIAIMDDGVQLNHPDLAANLFTNTGEVASNGFDDDGNGIIDDRQGYNFVVNLPDANPYSVDDNHGTAVAGIAAAAGNNSVGTVGAAYGCRVLPVKVLEGDFSATTSDFAKALRYVAGLNSSGQTVWSGADVVNISLTFGQSIVTDAALADVVTKGRNGKGCPVFVAAGNSAGAWEPVEYDVTEAGTYTLRFEYSKDSVDVGSVGSDTVWIDSIRFPDGTLETFEGGLPDGWLTSSFSPWRIVTEGVSGNLAMVGWNGPGSKSLRAGTITHGQTNWAEFTTTLTVGKLVLWAWVSSEYQYDYFDFWVGHNGNETLIFSQSGVPILAPVVSYPANNANTIAVGASTDFDYRADYSQYGPQLDFLAPSDGGLATIVTTDRTGTAGYNAGGAFDSNYTLDFGGTSAATPLSAGVAALTLSLNPYLTAADVRALLRGTCDRIGSVTYDANGRNLYYGSGRINAAHALAQSSPNLRVTLASPASPVTAGDPITYTIEVRNIGFSRSGAITVTNPLPSGVSLISANPAPSSQANGRLTFTAGSLAAGASWTITVTANTSTAGTPALLAGATTDVLESSTTDNSASGTLTILPVPQISVASAEVQEGQSGKTNVPVRVSLSNAASRKVSVTFQTVTNTAQAGSDFAPLKTTVTFAPGETNKLVAVSVVGDTRNEADETFGVQLLAPVNATLATASATITILNDDAIPLLSAAEVLRTEGNGGAAKAVFKFTLSAASGRVVTVDYATASGTAQSGVDFLPTNGVLTIPAGKTTAAVTVLIPGDKVLETNETFRLTLANAVNCTLAADSILGTILNNDPAPKAYIDDTGIVEGGSGGTNATLRVRLATPSELPVTLAFATTNGTAVAGQDYLATNGLVVFGPGETNQTIQIAILGDAIAEPLESFSVRLTGLTNALVARPLARVSITNDDSALQLGGAVAEMIAGPAANILILPGPRLQVTRLGGTSLQLSWGSNWTGYRLESSPSPAADGPWEPVSVTPVAADGRFTVEMNLPSETGARFFRLVFR